MNETLVLNFDGGSRGNPGPAGVGVVIAAQDGTPLVTVGKFIGRATNNVAEYRGLITALQEARKLGAHSVIIRGDSELIIKQMRGEYRVKNPDLKILFEQAQTLLRQFKSTRLEHNLRGKNATADRLANLAMDKRADVDELTDPAGASSENDDPAPSAPHHDAPALFSAKPAVADTPSSSAPPGTRLSCQCCGSEIQILKAAQIPQRRPGQFICQCGTPFRNVVA